MKHLGERVAKLAGMAHGLGVACVLARKDRSERRAGVCGRNLLFELVARDGLRRPNSAIEPERWSSALFVGGLGSGTIARHPHEGASSKKKGFDRVQGLARSLIAEST